MRAWPKTHTHTHMSNTRNPIRGASPSILKNAKALRKRSTPAEKLMWRFVRNRKMFGLKFRRQQPLNYFIADFYCHEALLVIELDGSIHDRIDIKKYDAERQKIIEELGITVMRFSNDDVFTEPNKIEREIKKHLGIIGFSPLPKEREM